MAEQCETGVQLNWLTYMINELLGDVEEAQKNGSPFHILGY